MPRCFNNKKCVNLFHVVLKPFLENWRLQSNILKSLPIFCHYSGNYVVLHSWNWGFFSFYLPPFSLPFGSCLPSLLLQILCKWLLACVLAKTLWNMKRKSWKKAASYDQLSLRLISSFKLDWSWKSWMLWVNYFELI